MAHAHYNRQDDRYYCDLCLNEGKSHAGWQTADQCRDHVRTVHQYERVTIQDADADPKNRKHSGHDLTAAEIIDLQNWDVETRIFNPIPLEKQLGDKRQRFTLKALLDANGGLKLEPSRRVLNLPPDTPMSLTAAQAPPADEPLVQIFRDLQHQQGEYVFLQSAAEYDLVTLGTIVSFFHESFRALPFFGFISPGRGSGKSTATKVMIFAGYNGVWTVDPSKASFFRIIDDAKGIIGFDQIDDILRNPEARADFLAVIDAAHQRGIWVSRCERDSTSGPMDIKWFSPFCILAWNGTRRIPESLHSRSIVIPMIECSGKKRLKQLPVADTFRDIRDRLYVWRLRHHDLVTSTCNGLETEGVKLTDRYRDVFMPLLTLAKLVGADVFQRILTYAQAFAEERHRTQHDHRIEILVSLLSQFVGEHPVVDIRDVLNPALEEAGELSFDKEGNPKKITSQWVQTQLDGMSIKRGKLHVHNLIHYVIGKEQVEQLQRVYGLLAEDDPAKKVIGSACQRLVAKGGVSPIQPIQPIKTNRIILRKKPVEPEDRLDSLDRFVAGQTGLAKPPAKLKPNPAHVERVLVLLHIIRQLAATTERQQVDEVHLLERCQRMWGDTFDARTLQANLDELAKRGKIIRTESGAVQPV